MLPWQPILWRDTATNWRTPPLLFVLALYNGWAYRNADCSVNIDDNNSSTSGKNFVNICLITREILLLISMGGWLGGCTHGQYIRTFPMFPPASWIDLCQTFKKYGEISRFHTKRFWYCDGLLKGHCYGNRFVAHVGENWHTPSSFCALAFNKMLRGSRNGWQTFTPDDLSTSCTHFVNFDPVIS